MQEAIWSDMYKLACVLTLLCLQGCSTTLPLCPKVADKSYAAEDSEKSNVNKYVNESAKRKNISIIEISAFEAEFTGSPAALAWLKSNYESMLCAFNPNVELMDKATFVSCMQHAKEWIDAIDSEEKENLFLDHTKYQENCVP